MKILFHCWEYPPNGTGVGYYIQQMAISLRMAGHECVILTGKAEGCSEESQEEAGVILRKYNRIDIGSSSVTDLVLDTARKHKVDIIEGSDHLGECAGVIANKNRPTVMVKVHSSNAIKALLDSQIMYW